MFRPGDYLQLAKARLTALVVVTTAVGYVVSSGAALDAWRLVWTLLGTALAAGGANALNQWQEAALDGRMRRTRGRPVPSGRMPAGHALAFAAAVATLGPVLLALLVNPLTAGLAAATILLYVLVYTPLKTRSPACTLVGAICGAIPPMMGCTAVLGRIDHHAWILAALLFIWQIPHFLALAWLYRDDYAVGGFRMLPVLDRSGAITCRLIVVYTLALLPIGLATLLTGMAGWFFAATSLLLGAGFLAVGLRLHRQRTGLNARRLFLVSIVYLPVALGLMVADRGPASGLSPWAGVDVAEAEGLTSAPVDPAVVEAGLTRAPIR